MTRYFLAGFLAVGIALTCVYTAEAAEGSGSKKPEAIKLFNGTDLTGLYTFLRERGRNSDPKGVFAVTNGVLRISGEEFGFIASEKEFENYHLVMEYKWGEKTWGDREAKARDSGLLMHSVGEDNAYGGTWMRSVQCQMGEGMTGDLTLLGDRTPNFAITATVAPERVRGRHVYDPDGKPVTVHGGAISWFNRDPEWANEKGFRGKNDVDKPIGEWNKLECIADGGSLTAILNGVTVNKALEVKPCKGKVQIQTEGSELFIRRLDLLPLAKK